MTTQKVTIDMLPTIDEGDVQDDDLLVIHDTSDDSDKAVKAALVKGTKGDKGDTGNRGPRGNTGRDGSPGATGSQGPKGDTGAKGAQGLQGIQGIRGLTGIQGEKGDTGPPGAAGADGMDGAKGDKGDQGDKGEEGSLTAVVVTKYNYNEHYDLTFTPITSATASARKYTVNLLDETTPGGIVPNIDFVSDYEGAVYFNASENQVYNMTLEIIHVFQDNTTITATRTIQERVRSADIFTLPLNVFHSRSQVRVGSYFDGTNTINITPELLKADTQITINLIIEGKTRDFQVESLSHEGMAVTFWQIGAGVEEGNPVKGDKGDQGIQGPQGDQGATGPMGMRGEQGQAGIQGPKGDKGDQGDKGDKGDTGAAGADGADGDRGSYYVRIFRAAVARPPQPLGGVYDPNANELTALPGGGNAEPVEPDYDAGERLWVSEAFVSPEVNAALVTPEWSLYVELGLPGAEGEKGDKGDKGEKGDKGDKGEKGDKGDQGLQGSTGAKGTAGLRGSRIGQGNGDATDAKFLASTLVDAQLDDYYLDVDTFSLWERLNPDDTWNSLGTIQGPKGNKGDRGMTGNTGSRGPKGDTGATGPQGDAGMDGMDGAAGSLGVTLVNTATTTTTTNTLSPNKAGDPTSSSVVKDDLTDLIWLDCQYTRTNADLHMYSLLQKSDIPTLNYSSNSEPTGAHRVQLQGVGGDYWSFYFDGSSPGLLANRLVVYTGDDGVSNPAVGIYNVASGETGPAGPQGPKGAMGDTGPRGPQGDKGDTGPQGPEGGTGILSGTRPPKDSDGVDGNYWVEADGTGRYLSVWENVTGTWVQLAEAKDNPTYGLTADDVNAIKHLPIVATYTPSTRVGVAVFDWNSPPTTGVSSFTYATSVTKRATVGQLMYLRVPIDDVDDLGILGGRASVSHRSLSEGFQHLAGDDTATHRYYEPHRIEGFNSGADTTYTWDEYSAETDIDVDHLDDDVIARLLPATGLYPAVNTILEAGQDITITDDDTNKQITIAAKREIIDTDWGNLALNFAFRVGNVVRRLGRYYICIKANSKAVVGPDNDATNWQPITNFSGAYDAAYYYHAGEWVIYDSKPAFAMMNIIPTDPVPDHADNTKWFVAGSGGGGGGVPDGGDPGQLLIKQSDTDGDATWETHDFDESETYDYATLTIHGNVGDERVRRSLEVRGLLKDEEIEIIYDVTWTAVEQVGRSDGEFTEYIWMTTEEIGDILTTVEVLDPDGWVANVPVQAQQHTWQWTRRIPVGTPVRDYTRSFKAFSGKVLKDVDLSLDIQGSIIGGGASEDGGPFRWSVTVKRQKKTHETLSRVPLASYNITCTDVTGPTMAIHRTINSHTDNLALFCREVTGATNYATQSGSNKNLVYSLDPVKLSVRPIVMWYLKMGQYEFTAEVNPGTDKDFRGFHLAVSPDRRVLVKGKMHSDFHAATGTEAECIDIGFKLGDWSIASWGGAVLAYGFDVEIGVYTLHR